MSQHPLPPASHPAPRADDTHDRSGPAPVPDTAHVQDTAYVAAAASPPAPVDPVLLASVAKALKDAILPGEGDGFDDAAVAEAAGFVARSVADRPAGTPLIALEPLATAAGAPGIQRRMRLAIINDDTPFLVDSTSSAVAAQGLAIERIVHPVVAVARDPGGQLLRMGDDAATDARESWIYIELERGDARARRTLVDGLRDVLGDVRRAVADWPAMQDAMRADAARLDDGSEGRALLDWFVGGAMTQLGHEVRLPGGMRHDGSTPLGIASSGPDFLSSAAIDAAFAWFADGGRAPLLVKSNRLSTVHRRVLLDLVIMPAGTMDAARGAQALSIHAGLWTSAALSTPPAQVPVLRAEADRMLRKFGFSRQGHAGKALTHALTALPHDVSVALDAASLEQLALTSMSITDRPRPKLVTAVDALGRHLFVFVWLPRDEVSTGRRLAIEAMVAEAARARVIGWTIALEDGGTALLRFALDLRGGGVVPDAEALDAGLKTMVRGWQPDVEQALGALGEEARAPALALRFAALFPDAYRQSTGGREAALDILRLRDLGSDAPVAVRLSRNDGDDARHLRLKVYAARGALPLSAVVPALENFGFTVLQETPTALTGPMAVPGDDGADRAPGDAGAQAAYIHDFYVEVRADLDDASLFERAELVELAITDVLSGRAENDAFNQLALAGGIAPARINWLRALYRFMRQTGISYAPPTVVGALRGAPELTRMLLDRFVALHDPERASPAEAAALAEGIDQALTGVATIDDDRIIRTYAALIGATLRTNAFAPDADPVSRDWALAFKLDSSRIPGLPKPLPWREVWVYSARVEGVHLRSGPVARGGLRWSDRRDDFRTEILGLLKAQRVKNAVIVPTGAKGGFYPKTLPDAVTDRDGWLAEGTASYQLFIRTLLSITDNIVDGRVIHPEGVVVHDGEDPYFVVAADKGTAKFSDVANAIARERGFWLGDAFASGGSKGYDHKGMGITARGAWLSVRRHFAEAGIDVQADPVRVAGCGDMSGDVFGNGMLLSRSIKLVAAFDHRHIFLDPDPDPTASYGERQRLFALPRSSWADYDAALISRGGAVIARSQKAVTLSHEAQAMLGLDSPDTEPAALISAILRAPVDLLWFGGIGTYIKAASEAHGDVGDPTNDRLRVDGEAVRARVIGEGANLGVTQAGRIAFALTGGRINTDFIDNSAGVDCSDKEVNIKIALNREMVEGRLAGPDRDALLEQMTDDVAGLVLEDNRLQALALSIAQARGADAVPATARLIDQLEATGRLDRRVEGLAGNDDLMRRAQDGQGLTRPELAVLLSTAKLALQDAIETSALPDDPTLVGDLMGAFPAAMQERFATAIQNHQLRREIIATVLANRIVNRLGILHPFELAEEDGCPLSDMAAMFVVAERLFDMRALWHRLDFDPMEEPARLALFTTAASGMASQMADLLRTMPPGAMPGPVIARLAPGVGRLTAAVDTLMGDTVRQQWDQLAHRLADTGADDALTGQVVRLFTTDGVVGIADLAARTGRDEQAVTHAFTRLGAALGLDWAQTVAARMSPADPWERLLVNGLARDFQTMRLDFMARQTGEADPVAGAEAWLAANAERVAAFRKLIDRARLSPAPNGAMLSHLAGQARGLLAR